MPRKRIIQASENKQASIFKTDGFHKKGDGGGAEYEWSPILEQADGVIIEHRNLSRIVNIKHREDVK